MFRITKVIAYFCLFIFSICGTSCTYDVAEKSTCTDIPDSVSFSANVIPILNNNCSIPSCHSGIEPTGNLNLEDAVAYQNLWRNGSGYLDTVNANHSILYTQLVSSTLPMPPTGPLDSCNINLILKWIDQGAKNN